MHIIKDKNVTAGTNCKEYRFYEQKVTESVRKEKNELRQKQHPSGASGDYHDMQKNAEILKTMNSALSEAYAKKTGRSKDEILKMMDKETWITAEKALELGFIDKIENSGQQFFNCVCGVRLTDEIRNKVKQEKEAQEAKEQQKKEILRDLDQYGI